MRHTYADLKQMQSLPLEIKVKMSKRRIEEWYEHYQGDVYISFSGGKDSTVLKHLGEGIPSLFIDTGLEYPEVREFALENCTWRIKPRMHFKEVLRVHGYPVISKDVAQTIESARRNGKDSFAYKKLTDLEYNGKRSRFCLSRFADLYDAPFKISAKCCDEMKKKPAREFQRFMKMKPILGNLADESVSRRTAWMRNGCNAFEAKHPSSTPLAFWTDQDILQYIHDNQLPYAKCYGDIYFDGEWKTTGLERTGCMFCMFGAHLDDRFVKMRENYPSQYKYCMETLGLGEILDYLKIAR